MFLRIQLEDHHFKPVSKLEDTPHTQYTQCHRILPAYLWYALTSLQKLIYVPKTLLSTFQRKEWSQPKIDTLGLKVDQHDKVSETSVHYDRQVPFNCPDLTSRINPEGKVDWRDPFRWFAGFLQAEVNDLSAVNDGPKLYIYQGICEKTAFFLCWQLFDGFLSIEPAFFQEIPFNSSVYLYW